MFLVGLFIGSVIGLLVGWNLFPQPEKVKTWFEKTFK